MLKIDYKYITNILPQVDKRIKTDGDPAQTRLDWLYLLSYNLVELSQTFESLYNQYVFDSNHNSQVILLEGYLNTVLSPISPITIEEGLFVSPSFISQRDEQFTTIFWMGQRGEVGADESWIAQRDETLENRYDFKVVISGSDAGLEPQIRAIIDRLKIGGKEYIIEII